MLSFNVRTIGLKAVQAKLLLAKPRILEQNRVMVEAMLAEIKPIVAAQTPYGPGHFGYHLRDMFTVDTKFAGVKTIGVLKSPPTGYWREFGTVSHFHHGNTRRGYSAAIGMFGAGGERAFLTAHKALSGVRRFVNFYYGGMAKWWRA